MLRELATTEEGLLQAQRDAQRTAALEARGLRLVAGQDSPPEHHGSDLGWSALDLDDVGSGTPL